MTSGQYPHNFYRLFEPQRKKCQRRTSFVVFFPWLCPMGICFCLVSVCLESQMPKSPNCQRTVQQRNFKCRQNKHTIFLNQIHAQKNIINSKKTWRIKSFHSIAPLRNPFADPLFNCNQTSINFYPKNFFIYKNLLKNLFEL